MKSAQKQYTNEMKRKFGYYATWNPGVPLQLGDVGIFKNNVFTKISDLESFQITFDIREDQTEVDLEHSSQGSVSVTTKLSGTVAPHGSVLADADAGIVVEFGKDNSTLFKANKTVSPTIKDTIQLGNIVLELFKQGKWNKNWAIITELVKAESATIIISNSSNSKIELKANANVDAPSFDIADANFEFSTLISKGLETMIIAAEGITPLFKCMGIKTGIFVPPVFRAKGINAFDLLTPDAAKEKHSEDIYFGYLSSDERE